MSKSSKENSTTNRTLRDLDPEETQEWIDSLDYILRETGKDRAIFILNRLQEELDKAGHPRPFTANTAYVNTIPPHRQPAYPGNIDLEKRIRCLVRWNAMAMVVRANRMSPGIGGHISTFASLAMLLEVGFNHFFRAPSKQLFRGSGLFSGHASPGVYARAFLEGRLSETQLEKFSQGIAARGRAIVLSPSMVDAKFLAIPHGLYGVGSHHGNLSSPIQPLPRTTRFAGYLSIQSVGVYGRW